MSSRFACPEIIFDPVNASLWRLSSESEAIPQLPPSGYRAGDQLG